MPTKRFGTYKRKNYDDIKKRNQEHHDRRIRAKAIDEFAEVLIDRLCNEYLKYNDGTWNGAIDEAIKIVKQLKEGGKK